MTIRGIDLSRFLSGYTENLEKRNLFLLRAMASVMGVSTAVFGIAVWILHIAGRAPVAGTYQNPRMNSQPWRRVHAKWLKSTLDQV